MNITRRLIGDIFAMSETNLGEDSCLRQVGENRTNQANGDFQFTGNIFGGQGRFRNLEPFYAQTSNQEGDQDSERVTCSLTILFELVGGNMLMRKRDFCTKKNNEPAELQPRQKQRQRGEATVNCAILGHTDLEWCELQWKWSVKA